MICASVIIIIIITIIIITIIIIIQSIAPSLETVVLRVTNLNFRDLFCLMLTLNVETVLPLDALQQKMTLAVILTHSTEFKARLMIG